MDQVEELELFAAQIHTHRRHATNTVQRHLADSDFAILMFPDPHPLLVSGQGDAGPVSPEGTRMATARPLGKSVNVSQPWSTLGCLPLALRSAIH